MCLHVIVQGRLTNVQDIPLHTPYFFRDPDWTTSEAIRLRDRVNPENRGENLSLVGHSIVR